MFPVNDINFVVCGFATVAATMGYACSRRYAHNSTSPTEQLGDRPDDKTQIASPSNEKVIDQNETLLHKPEAVVPSTALSRRSSLKRKRPNDDDDDDDYSNAGYPLNLLSIYPPAKRSRTPPSDIDDSDTIISAAAAPETPARTDVEEGPKVEAPPPVDELPSLTASPRSESSDEGSEGPSTPPDVPLVLPLSPKKSPLDLASPAPPATPPPPKRSATFGGTFSNGGFAAFAGSSSPFSSQSFSSPSPARGIKPAWCIPSGSKSIFDAPNEPSSKALGVEEVAIAPAEVRSDSPQTHITGEEDEEAELELKNIKLFVKRGKKNFSNGMIGSIKLLSNKSTNSERLLFRREPLWKVSMNVRVNTSVRCTFDAEEHVLRIVLAETVESPEIPAEQWPREIVVYALKPGRSSKTDFAAFAEALIARPNLTSTPPQ